MASGVSGIWAIDIGGTSLKALRLRHGEQGLDVIGFDYIEHSKILSGGDVGDDEKRHIIGETLHQFVSRNDVRKDEVAISIAGHNSFARFIKLPPVEQKRIPEIVQFEAVQQIPFDINEVEWDWQVMKNPDSSDTEVGIFAIKNELISEIMDHFTRENLKVTCVQLSPMSLYNYAMYDRSDIGGPNEKATVLLDMGAENTTLVVCTKTTVWQRSIRIGGDAFTEAIAEAFKLRFEKAEKLKRTAPMSKYMRQIFTAMKPVFTDLGSEVQRSLGFYSSSGPGREVGFSKIIALGGGMKLQGLAKYLQQTLGVPVIKPDSFEKLKVSADASSAKFHENISDFGIVYGLGIQLLEDAKISVNLLPRKIARSMAWARKGRNFTIAAGLLLSAAVLSFVSVNYARSKYSANENARREIASVISDAQTVRSEVANSTSGLKPLSEVIQKQMDIFKYRQVVPELNEFLIRCLPNAENSPLQKNIYEAFETGDVKTLTGTPRQQRKLLFVTNVTIEYAKSLSSATFPDTRQKGGGRSTGTGGRAMPMMRPDMMMDMMMMQGMGPGGMMPPMGGRAGRIGRGGLETGKTEQTEDGAGFVVVIEGYSPYQNINELMDPPKAGDDQDKWGVVTRLENLEKLFGKSPFKLFGKGDTAHFKVETGVVDPLIPEMPAGIGVPRELTRVPQDDKTKTATAMTGAYDMMGYTGRGQDRISTEKVLIDPMTNEEISRVYDIITQQEVSANPNLTENDIGKKKTTEFGAEKFIERDNWFRIKAKFIWKDAPPPPNTGMMQGMM